MVMGNMFNLPVEVHRRFDLKGSWVGRSTSSKVTEKDHTIAMKVNNMSSCLNFLKFPKIIVLSGYSALFQQLNILTKVVDHQISKRSITN